MVDAPDMTPQPQGQPQAEVPQPTGDAAPAPVDAQPVDWQKRYTDLQAFATKVNQKNKDYEVELERFRSGGQQSNASPVSGFSGLEGPSPSQPVGGLPSWAALNAGIGGYPAGTPQAAAPFDPDEPVDRRTLMQTLDVMDRRQAAQLAAMQQRFDRAAAKERDLRDLTAMRARIKNFDPLLVETARMAMNPEQRAEYERLPIAVAEELIWHQYDLGKQGTSSAQAGASAAGSGPPHAATGAALPSAGPPQLPEGALDPTRDNASQIMTAFRAAQAARSKT